MPDLPNSAEWLEKHIRDTQEINTHRRIADELGMVATQAAQEWFYGDIPTMRRDMTMMRLSFDEFATVFMEIIHATVTTDQQDDYTLQDIRQELVTITGSEHVASQLMDRMLDKNIIAFSDLGRVFFLKDPHSPMKDRYSVEIS